MPCAICDKPVWQVASKAQDGYNTYCSIKCRGIGMRNRVTFSCGHCGKDVERAASTILREVAFCSKQCAYEFRKYDPASVARVRQMQRDHLASRAPTRCETALYDRLDELVGENGWDAQHLVFGKWTVDAAIPELKLILQADGDYWHGRDPVVRSHPTVAANRANDARLDSYADKAGWVVLRLWETDLLRSPDGCRKRLQQAIEQQRGVVSTTATLRSHDS